MKVFFKIILVIFITLLFSESLLRLVDAYSKKYAPGNESGRGLQSYAMKKFVQEKINSLWIRKRDERKDIFEPPFDVFVNKDFDNQERLAFIAAHSVLPPNIHITTENFLRGNAQLKNETFTVNSNSLGFRGIERDIKKPKDVFRIILLGSYPAFGHAVNDEETYASILEANLNQRLSGSKKVEIWNGGKQGATSIMGYARLKNEVMKYSPDLILWDYGWIELYLGRDMVSINGTREEVRKLNSFQRKLIHGCISTPLSSLALCKFSLNKMTKVSYDEAIDGWKKSMTLLKEWSDRENVPVIFLRHKGVTIPRREYAAFDNPKGKMHFIDTTESLDPEVTNEERNIFWTKDNWLSELGVSEEEAWKSDPKLIFYGDAIQYNRLGYKRIGNFLTDKILDDKYLFSSTFKK